MFLVSRPITAKIKTRDRPQKHKLVNVVACGLVFSRLIGFFLATQLYSRNICGVHGFPGLTATSIIHANYFAVSDWLQSPG